MNKTLQLFAFLLALTFTLAENNNSSFPSNSTNSTGLRSSKTGTVKLFKDSRGFYAIVDFQYDYSHASDSFGEHSYPMMVGLYTNQTILASSCMKFDFYDCPTWKCAKRTDTITKVNYPFFSADGYYIAASVYLEYSNWVLYSNALFAQKCSSGGSSLYGQNTFGILGMGLEGSSKRNFPDSKVFSIWLQKDRTAGRLLFKEDLGCAKSRTPVARISTDDNWKGNAKTVAVGTSPIYLQDTKLIFDLSSDAIGLPDILFGKITDLLKRTYRASCMVLTYEVTCTYDGYLSDLPTIYIYGDWYTLPIVPQIYVQDYDSKRYVSSTITLNLKPLSSFSAGRYYVAREYENHIILDTNVMSYYYTVFDANYAVSGIRLYYAGDAPSPDTDPDTTPQNYAWVVIVAGVFFVAIVSTIVKACSRTKPNTSSNIINEQQQQQQPLIVNTQTHNFANYNQQQYIQQPYGYIQPQQPQYPQQPQQPAYSYNYNYGNN